MSTLNPTPFNGSNPFTRRRTLPALAATLFFVLAAFVALTLAGTGPAGAQDDALSVAVSANPPNPEIDVPVIFSADISNPPADGTPSYRWELKVGHNSWMRAGSNSTFSYVMANPGSTTVRVKVSYGGGVSATSEPLTVHWTVSDGYTPIPATEPPPEPTATPEPTQEPTATPVPTATPTPPPAPSVSGVAITSDPGDDDTYAANDVIEVTVTFSEAVNVTGSPRQRIKMDPNYGGKWAGYAGGSGSSTLTFNYTVEEPNISTQGVAVLANTLELNGGSIQSAAYDADADLAHAGLATTPTTRWTGRARPPRWSPWR